MMMKKLLIFMLVLGMASAANAAISLQIDSVDIPSTAGIEIGETIQIYSDSSSTWLGYIIIETGGAGTLTTPVLYDPPAGDNSYIRAYSYTGWGDGYEMAADWLGPSPTASGVQFTVDITGILGNTGVLSLWEDPEYTVPAYPSVSYTLIPEPMTIALLGLGGLLLRRRK